MYRNFNTFESDETDLIIRYLERVQLGYSDLILLALEKGWSEEIILADIEDLVKNALMMRIQTLSTRDAFRIRLKPKRTSEKYHKIFSCA